MRVPPSLTSSATTPSLRRFTSSMKTGGKDHSRPMSRPTFNVITFLPYYMAEASAATTILRDVRCAWGEHGGGKRRHYYTTRCALRVGRAWRRQAPPLLYYEVRIVRCAPR